MKLIRKYFKSAIHISGNFLRWVLTLYLRTAGVRIGNNTMISLRAKIDVRRGKVIIGNNCHITYGCIILSHDGSAIQIDPNDDGEGEVNIGDNVFIGVNSVVLPNVTIGDNSVIGAGSVVTQDIPSGVIAVGNPIKIVREIEWLKK